LPPAAIKCREHEHYTEVFDPLRRRWIKLTPEEWVRQNFVRYLIDHKGYVKGNIANEMEITLNGLSKRCDSVVYDRTGKPVMIIEYKAPEVPVTQKVFEQILRYNIRLQVPHLIVSNGLKHFYCRLNHDKSGWDFLPEVPDYTQL